MKYGSPFEIWRRAVGIKAKEAAELLGFGTTKVTALNTGKQDPTKTDLLAMAAIKEGLAPWEPEAASDNTGEAA